MKDVFVRTLVRTENRFRSIRTQFEKHENLPDYNYPYKNLVFKGGGIRGIAYVGALEILEKYGILSQIERVAGTSAGAITATLVSLRISYKETLAKLRSLDFSSIPQIRTSQTKSHELLSSLGLRNGELVCTSRLINEYGWYSSQYFYDWLQDTIAIYCDGNGRATFAEFEERGFRELSIVATNLSKRRPEVFSNATTPHVAVADAVRMSMSIPFYFNALRFDGHQFGDGDLYVDGGMYNNFPIQIFDDPIYALKNPWYLKGINWQTLGCYLYPEQTEEKLRKETNSLRDYLELTVSNFFDAFQAMSYENSSLDQRRTIKINDCGISPVEFNIPLDSPLYFRLINSGRDATENFLKDEFPKDLFV